MMLFRAGGAAGTIGCGLALLCLGLFLLTPLAVLLIKGVGWMLLIAGALVAGVGVWTWWSRR